jgi:hypothetical protein
MPGFFAADSDKTSSCPAGAGRTSFIQHLNPEIFSQFKWVSRVKLQNAKE